MVMADRLPLEPFGSIEKLQTSRLMRQYAVKSTLRIEWNVIQAFFEERVEDDESRDALKRAIQARGEDANVSRQLYEKLSNTFSNLGKEWNNFIKSILQDLIPMAGKWHHQASRGYFRLLLIVAIFLQAAYAALRGGSVHKNGLGGRLKRALEHHSKGFTKTRAGSLYSALERFEQNGLIRSKQDQDQEILILSPLAYTVMELGLKSVGIIASEIHETGVFKVIDARLMGKLEEIARSMEKIAKAIKIGLPIPHERVINNLRTMNDSIERFRGSSFFMRNATKITVDQVGARKQLKSDLNRGMLDIYVLGLFLDEAQYGGAIIDHASKSFRFTAGTLYPKLQNWLDEGFIAEISPERAVDIMKKGSFPKKGPEKKFYKITIPGMVYLSLIVIIFLKDLHVLFNLLDEYFDVVERAPDSK
ncbi:hypothetical protein GF325_14365 [Candidatus Bathyarchaeota archaeon]|nr:hypothetical protein [Candidatus Bathyarchaeota archaeon]